MRENKKRCTRCKKLKPLSEYYRYSAKNKTSSANKLMNRCKDCYRAANRVVRNGPEGPRKDCYEWTDDQGFQVREGVTLSLRWGPWPFCGHCRVRRAVNASEEIPENQTSYYRRTGKAPPRAGVPQTYKGVPICLDCLTGRVDGPKSAVEWAEAYGKPSNLENAKTDIDECKISWEKTRKHLSTMIKKNGWREEDLHPWNKTIRGRHEHLREAADVKNGV